MQHTNAGAYRLITLPLTPIQSQDQVTCTVPEMPAGNYDLDIELGAQGWPFFQLPGALPGFQHAIIVSAVSPATGSHWGGTNVTITGKGFCKGCGTATPYVPTPSQSGCVHRRSFASAQGTKARVWHGA